MRHLAGSERLASGYADEPRPLAAYAGMMAAFNMLFAVFLLIVRQRRQEVPGRLRLGDMLLVGVATHKLSRLLAKDIVTSPLRAPFTTYQGPGFGSEVREEPRGEGWQRALGELLTCPYCLSQWVAAFGAYGLVLAPQLTRFVASIFGLLALSDLLHLTLDTLIALRWRVDPDTE